MLKSILTNQARAIAASIAFQTYQHAKGLADEPPQQSAQETLIDLLTDLRYFAEAEEIDFEAAVRVSADHFEEESS